MCREGRLVDAGGAEFREERVNDATVNILLFLWNCGISCYLDSAHARRSAT